MPSRTQVCRWFSSISPSIFSMARRTAYVCFSTSTQYLSSSIMRRTPWRCPSIKASRLRTSARFSSFISPPAVRFFVFQGSVKVHPYPPGGGLATSKYAQGERLVNGLDVLALVSGLQPARCHSERRALPRVAPRPHAKESGGAGLGRRLAAFRRAPLRRKRLVGTAHRKPRHRPSTHHVDRVADDSRC